MKKILILCALLIVNPVFGKNTVTNNMNQLYQELINDNKNDPEYIKKVKEVKKKWKEFVRSQAELVYPQEGLGILQRPCVEEYKKNLDRALMNETKYLFYIEEGSPCTICN